MSGRSNHTRVGAEAALVVRAAVGCDLENVLPRVRDLVFTAGGRLESVMMCLFGCFAELFTLPQYRVWQVCTCSGLRRGIWYLFW